MQQLTREPSVHPYALPGSLIGFEKFNLMCQYISLYARASTCSTSNRARTKPGYAKAQSFCGRFGRPSPSARTSRPSRGLNVSRQLEIVLAVVWVLHSMVYSRLVRRVSYPLSAHLRAWMLHIRSLESMCDEQTRVDGG